jgi:hypothetical protein
MSFPHASGGNPERESGCPLSYKSFAPSGLVDFPDPARDVLDVRRPKLFSQLSRGSQHAAIRRLPVELSGRVCFRKPPPEGGTDDSRVNDIREVCSPDNAAVLGFDAYPVTLADALRRGSTTMRRIPALSCRSTRLAICPSSLVERRLLAHERMSRVGQPGTTACGVRNG